MNQRPGTPTLYQRNALAPGILAAAALFVAPALLEGEGFLIIRFIVAILAIVVAWFAVQARHWWWVPVFAAIAVVWNPVFPFAFSGPLWFAAQLVAAVVFLVAGALIRFARPA